MAKSEHNNSSDKPWKIILFPRTIISVLLVIIVIAAIPVTNFLLTKRQDIRQRAAPGTKTATISVNPFTASFNPGQQFTVDLVIDGGGQAFNAAQANVAISSNLTVNNLTILPPNSGGCNFTFVRQNKTPSPSNASFAGAILNGSSTHCTLYRLTLTANTIGTATIQINGAQVKAYLNSTEILLSVQNGSYSINNPITPTAVPTNTPTPTVIPTSTPIPTAVPTLIPSTTPIPTNVPTPVVVAPPTFSSITTETYNSQLTLGGTKDPTVTTVFVNNSSTQTVYPDSTSWQYPATLSLGPNTFTIYGRDSQGNTSTSNSITINMHKTADINGDAIVDLTDLSLFATDWENTDTLNHQLSDMDGDGLVDLTDFSILARAYEF